MRSLYHFLLLPCLLSLLATQLSPTSALEESVYAPVASLDTEKYMGRWFQMYTNILFFALELGANCVTADYTLRTDGKVALVNQARPVPFFPLILARTTGFVAQSPTTPGAFTVDQGYFFSLDPADTEFEDPGNYWILAVGPIVGGQYDWAVVSDADKRNSFVLARDVDTFRDMYEDDALAVFDDIGGFDEFSNKPRRTPHFLCGKYRS